MASVRSERDWACSAAGVPTLLADSDTLSGGLEALLDSLVGNGNDITYTAMSDSEGPEAPELCTAPQWPEHGSTPALDLGDEVVADNSTAMGGFAPYTRGNITGCDATEPAGWGDVDFEFGTELGTADGDFAWQAQPAYSGVKMEHGTGGTSTTSVLNTSACTCQCNHATTAWRAAASRPRVRARVPVEAEGGAAAGDGSSALPARPTKRQRRTAHAAAGSYTQPTAAARLDGRQTSAGGGEGSTGAQGGAAAGPGARASACDSESKSAVYTGAPAAKSPPGTQCNFPGCKAKKTPYRIPAELLCSGHVEQFTTCKKHWAFVRRCTGVDTLQPHKTCQSLGQPRERCRSMLLRWEHALPEGVAFARRVWNHAHTGSCEEALC